MTRKIALFSKGITEKTVAGLHSLVDALHSRGAEIYLNVMGTGADRFINDSRVRLFESADDLPEDMYLVISVGGDGTFLETAMRVRGLNIPVAGINTGRLGFLANIPDDNIGKAMEMLCSGAYEVISRSMLEIVSPGGLFGDKGSLALNEVTVQKSDQRMIAITVSVNGIYLNTYQADGLIISTSTGSTAYNLSVGGPILSPSDESFIIAPMSPHNLTVRPIIITGNSTIMMETGGRSTECMITCDSRAVHLPLGVKIEVRQAPMKLKTVTPLGNDFFSTLRNKLMWGADLRN
ncbi:MAG: NAD(+)/NADH kinase [Bacteroidales bacterium]|nr:NAD(+)/NADH kinase [Bacteroidales bacterium]